MPRPRLLGFVAMLAQPLITSAKLTRVIQVGAAGTLIVNGGLHRRLAAGATVPVQVGAGGQPVEFNAAMAGRVDIARV